MAFSITSFTADANNKVVSVDWQYSNDDGAINNTHVLATPAGDFLLEAVTEGVLISWLNDQLENTEADFDAAIAAAKAQYEYESGFTRYTKEDDSTYTVLVED